MDTTMIINEVYYLIDEIKETPIYKAYQESLSVFNHPEVKALLRQKDELSEVYLNYQQEQDLIKLKAIKKKIALIPEIQNYYDKLRKLDDLLFEVNQWMFNDISKHLKIQRYEL